jgi:hypothetical protein
MQDFASSRDLPPLKEGGPVEAGVSGSRVSFLSRFLLPALLLNLAACPDHESRLDDAIRQYVDQRGAEVQALCECYHLFLNPTDIVDHDMFTSKDECLEVFDPPPEDDVVNCIKSVLDSSTLRTEDSVSAVKCYTEVIAEKTDCYAQNAGECTDSVCSSDTLPVDECRGQLTVVEAESLYNCAFAF